MVGTNPPLCETHISDDEANERIINPKELRVFASRHNSFWQELAHNTLHSKELYEL